MSSNAEFFIDPSRCIGCRACVQACGECGTHRGVAMIHLEYINRADGVQTAPVVCMHCENPACASVCPADAIKQNDAGVVMSAMKPRCVACSNCALACPFGVPRVFTGIDLMMKCDMCYDRTSVDKKPMCATVCPSGALFYGSREEIAATRRERPINDFQFGRQTVRTKVNLMTAPGVRALEYDAADFIGNDDVAFPGGQPDVAEMATWDDALLGG